MASDTHHHRLFPLGNGRRHHMERTHTASTSAVSTTTYKKYWHCNASGFLSLEPILQSLFMIHTMTGADAAAAESAQEREAVVGSDFSATHATSSLENGLMSLITLTCGSKLSY